MRAPSTDGSSLLGGPTGTQEPPKGRLLRTWLTTIDSSCRKHCALLRQARLSDRSLTIELNGKACTSFVQASTQANRSTRFAQPLGWLPDVDSNHEHRG